MSKSTDGVEAYFKRERRPFVRLILGMLGAYMYSVHGGSRADWNGSVMESIGRCRGAERFLHSRRTKYYFGHPSFRCYIETD